MTQLLTEAVETVPALPELRPRDPEPRTLESTSELVCGKVFHLLLAQLIFIAIWSLVAQTGPVFVQRFFFGLDFADFYRAGSDWLHGINPYLRMRFFTPPPSLLVGTVFAWIPFDIAKIVFFVLNLGIILLSVRACARKLGLSNRCRDYLAGIALLFYPVYFLVERGNLEGLVLGCLCWAFCTENETVRGVLVGLAGGLKLYPLLLVAPSVRKRDWRFRLIALVTFSLLMVAFYPLLHSFVSSVLRRGSIFQQLENISPAGIIVGLCGISVGKWLYVTCWTGTFLLIRRRMQESEEEDRNILLFLPWMVAFPAQVFPYGGVLLLPVFAWKLSKMEKSGVKLPDKVFICGFLLLGIQAWALTYYFPRMGSHPVFHLANSLGMVFILCSLAMPEDLAIRKRPTAALA